MLDGHDEHPSERCGVHRPDRLDDGGLARSFAGVAVARAFPGFG
jgi:hypothetical protein